MKIAIAGKAGSGKSVAAKHLAEEYGFERMLLAGKLKEICSLHGNAHQTNEVVWLDAYNGIISHVRDLFPMRDEGGVKRIVDHVWEAFLARPYVEGKNRALLQCVGTDIFREFNETVWVDYLILKAHEFDNVVVDDVRFCNEFDALREDGWVMVYCAVPDDVRAARLEKCYGRPLTEEEANHPSERDLDNIPAVEWDWILNTAGAIETERTQVDELIDYIRGVDNA